MAIDKQKLEMLKAMLNGDYGFVEENKFNSETVSNDLHKNHNKVKQNETPALAQQLQQFEKIIDKALLSGRKQINIIHGKGKGILKNELHKRLQKIPQVKRYELNKNNEGETIVYFN